jgi:hypothetical protein
MNYHPTSLKLHNIQFCGMVVTSYPNFIIMEHGMEVHVYKHALPVNLDMYVGVRWSGIGFMLFLRKYKCINNVTKW